MQPGNSLNTSPLGRFDETDTSILFERGRPYWAVVFQHKTNM